ncbi:MAG: DUF3800 domain-containing protein [Firmicutes bacterium]|nr:DUF3800 domain-containing protein [Bacillota bacterium]
MPYTAYIEEAGDEGLGRGSRWFILGAVIVDKKKDLEVSKCIDEIKQKFRLQPLNAPVHWRNIKHTSIRRGIIDCLSQYDFHLSYVICDTSHDEITSSTLKGRGRLYFYLARILIERISWFGADLRDTVDLVFANRSNMLYSDLKNYLKLLLNDRTCQIKPGAIDSNRVSCQNVGQLKLLQVSDICNSSCFNALEFDQYNYYEERYLLSLADKLYRRSGNLFSYGFKILPGNLHQSEEVVGTYPWLKKI